MNSAIPEVTIPTLEGVRPALESFARTHPEITRLQVFGSVARREATAESDVDILASFAPGTLPRGLAGFVFYEEMEEELATHIGHPVHLLDQVALENAIRIGNTALAKAVARDGQIVYEVE